MNNISNWIGSIAVIMNTLLPLYLKIVPSKFNYIWHGNRLIENLLKRRIVKCIASFERLDSIYLNFCHSGAVKLFENM